MTKEMQQLNEHAHDEKMFGMALKLSAFAMMLASGTCLYSGKQDQRKLELEVLKAEAEAHEAREKAMKEMWEHQKAPWQLDAERREIMQNIGCPVGKSLSVNNNVYRCD